MEALAAVEVVLGVLTRKRAAYIARAHILEAFEGRAPARELQHVFCAVYVDAHSDFARNAQVVNCGEVIDFDDVFCSKRQPQAAPGDVAFEDLNTALECGVYALHLAGALSRQAGEFRLDQAHRAMAGRACKNPREQGGSQKTREPGKE